MCSSGESVRVNICGDEYSIKTDIDKETTIEVAEFVNQKMMELKKISSVRDNSKIAVLSALNIAGELFEYKIKCEKSQKELTDIHRKTENICYKIQNSFKK